MNVLEQCWSSFPDTMSIILVLTSCAFRLGGLIAEFLDSQSFRGVRCYYLRGTSANEMRVWTMKNLPEFPTRVRITRLSCA